MRAHNFSNLKELQDFLEVNKNERVFVLVVSAMDPKTGKYWCPDCESIKDIISFLLASVETESILAYYSVGSRDQWKDPSNPLRLGDLCGVPLTKIPSLLDTQSKRILVEEELTHFMKVEDFVLSKCDAVLTQ